MKKTIITFIVICLAQVTPAYSQEVLSLKECISYGLKSNLNARIASNNVSKAHAQVQEGYSAYLPQISASGQYTDNLKLQTTVIPAGVFGPQESQVKFGTKYNTQVTAELDQTIYDQSLITGLKELGPGIEIANLNAQQADENIIYNISYYYYQVLVYKQQLALLHEDESKYERLTKITALQVEKGVAKPIDNSRVQVSLNNTKSQISQTQNNYDLMLNRLRYAMGAPAKLAIAVRDSLPINDLTSLPPQQDEVNPENRADFKSQQLSARIDDLERKRIVAGYAPKLTGYAQYGAQAFNNNFGHSFDSWYDFSSIGLKLNVPIFDGLNKRAKTKEAKLTFDNAVKNLELTKQSIALDYQNSKTQLQRNADNITNDKLNLSVARDVYNNTTLQYQQGIANMSDLLNAESSFKEAQTNYTNSLLNFLIAQLDLEKSKGTLKNYYQTL
jgi:outer membrane protein TolC